MPIKHQYKVLNDIPERIETQLNEMAGDGYRPLLIGANQLEKQKVVVILEREKSQ